MSPQYALGSLDWAKDIRARSPHIELEYRYPENANVWVRVFGLYPRPDDSPDYWAIRGLPVIWRVKPAEQTFEIVPAEQTFEAEPADMRPGAQAQYYARVTAIAYGARS